MNDTIMTHEGGSVKQIEFRDIIGKDAMFLVSGAGTYLFKLSNGECKGAPDWFIDGLTLKYVRSVAAEAGVKYSAARRVPLRHKGENKKPRKKKVSEPCSRTVGMFPDE